MKIAKTVGVPRADGKRDFDIHTSDGRVFSAEREGQRFRISQRVGTIKELKQWILDGMFDGDDEVDPTGDRGDRGEPGHGTWDCVDPCALLVKYLDSGELEWGFNDPLLTETLDCHGWLTEDGEVDVRRARAELQRIETLKGRQ